MKTLLVNCLAKSLWKYIPTLFFSTQLFSQWKLDAPFGKIYSNTEFLQPAFQRERYFYYTSIWWKVSLTLLWNWRNNSLVGREKSPVKHCFPVLKKPLPKPLLENDMTLIGGQNKFERKIINLILNHKSCFFKKIQAVIQVQTNKTKVLSRAE